MEYNSANLLYFELRTDIGQYTQGQIDLVMSHINSYARKKLGGNLLQPSSQNIPPEVEFTPYIKPHVNSPSAQHAIKHPKPQLILTF